MSKKYRDLIIFCVSLGIAWWLLTNNYFHSLIEAVSPVKFLAEFIAGMFYSSFLTSPISVAALVVIAKKSDPLVTALIGGLGAMSVDLLIVKFFRKEASEDLSPLVKFFMLDKINKLIKKLHLEFLVVLVGCAIIASPLPDEIGLLLLQGTNLNIKQLGGLTFLLNTVGIFLIVFPFSLS